METVEEWVKFYHSIGWGILPAKKQKKCPALNGWERWQEERPSHETIDMWLKQGYFNNINLCLGKVSNIYEIDVDVENAPIGKLTFGYKDDELWVCESSKGKIKIFFKPLSPLPQKLDEKVNKNGEHVELRGDRHLSVLPPSLHPTGTHYTWLTDVKKHPLRPIDGVELYNTIIKRLRQEFKYKEERKRNEVALRSSSSGVRDFFFKSLSKGTPWNGQQGHYFRLAFCAELINNGYDDAQIQIFFKKHDKLSGEDYSHSITQKKIDELRKKGMHCWSNKKLKECCIDILEDLE